MGSVMTRIPAGDFIIGRDITEEAAREAIRRKVGRYIVNKRAERETKLA